MFKRAFLIAMLSAAFVFFQNFDFSQEYPFSLVRPMPRPPAIKRDVHLREQSRYTTPVVSAFRTSSDGRIGISLQEKAMKLYLFRPEQQVVHVLQDSPGVKLLESNLGFKFGAQVNEKIATMAPGSAVEHKTICDGTTKNQGSNPRSCGTGNLSDCYDLTVITARMYGADGSKFRLFGLPITVQVDSPKTNRAKIVKVTEGALVSGPVLQVGIGAFFEPIASADGRLLVTRFGRSELNWISDDLKSQFDRTSRTEIAYFYGTSSEHQEFAPCDVRQWSRAYPITHAPYHQRVREKYGFARYKFRDSFGREVADGAEFMATYPWIDKEAKHLMFSTLSNNLYRWDGSKVVAEYKTRCVVPEACKHPQTEQEIEEIETTNSRIKSFGIVGLWTHGKMVIFDGAINNTEYGLGESDDLQRSLMLYDGISDSMSWVRVGTGRIAAAGNWEQGSAGNTTFIESFENLFNFNSNLKPLRIGDVVWTINTGRTSEDFVFDDYINPHTLIASDMNAAFALNVRARALVYYGSPESTIRLQNAATSPPTFLKIPEYGQVLGTSRIEPVALGGIRGKGLYIFPDTRVEYEIGQQPESLTSWYTGLFLDFRGNFDGQIMRFPDGSTLVIRNRILEFRAPGGTVENAVDISQVLKLRRWVHFGIQSIERRKVQFHLDGEIYSEWDSRFFSITGGKLQVGNFDSGTAKFVGWIDELRVIAQDLNPEYKCNLARGTILKSESNRGASTNSLFQTLIKSRLVNSGMNDFYWCAVARGREEIHRNNIPNGARMVREELLIPEGTPIFNHPRPDASKNQFCLGCHVNMKFDANRPGSLRPQALFFRPRLDSEKDLRRQPMQHPRLMRGTIPSGLFGVGAPRSVIIQTGENGTIVDKWLNRGN